MQTIAGTRFWIMSLGVSNTSRSCQAQDSSSQVIIEIVVVEPEVIINAYVRCYCLVLRFQAS